MNIKKRGFTLIELLITIAILSLIFIISFYLVSNIFEKTKNEIDETSKNLILTASEDYAKEFRNDPDWKEEKQDAITNFCISLQSLINYGYFNSNEQIEKYKDDYIVKVTIDANGVYNQELIEKTDDSNTCQYYEINNSIENASGTITIKETDDAEEELGTLSYNVTEINNKAYNLNTNFSIDFETSNIIIPDDKKTYIALVIDKSLSMNNQYNNAKTAILNFSNYISNSTSNTKISLIEFANYANLIRDFEQKAISNEDFGSKEDIGENTNISDGVDYVSFLFTKLKLAEEESNENINYYTILFFNGRPTAYSNNRYSTEYFSNYLNLHKTITYCTLGNRFSCLPNSITYLEDASEYLKNTFNTKLIVVGYDLLNFNEKEKLQKIATQDSEFCVNSALEGYCYYDSTSSKIIGLFESISERITTEITSTEATQSTLKLIPSSSVTIKTDGNALDSIEKEFDLTESQTINLEENYELVLDDNIFADCTETNCSEDLDLFDSIEIILTYEDEEKIIEVMSPKVTITSEKVTTIN